MERILELLFGVESGFLSKGPWRIAFNPDWPFQETIPASIWNTVLAVLAGLIVYHVYRREIGSRVGRVVLASFRALVLALVLFLLNNPYLQRTDARVEPSVVGILVDSSLSMSVPDVRREGQPTLSRFEATYKFLSGLPLDQKPDDRAAASVLHQMRNTHNLALWSFSGDARELGVIPQFSPQQLQSAGANPPPADAALLGALQRLADLGSVGQNTRVATSIRSLMESLSTQRLAAVVVFTDGRDTPESSLAEAIRIVKGFGVRVYTVPVGSVPRSDSPEGAIGFRNVEVQQIQMLDTAFEGDIVNVKVTLRGLGLPAGQSVNVVLKDKATGLPLTGPDGRGARGVATIADDQTPVTIEIPFKPARKGPLEVIAEAELLPEELFADDNRRSAFMEVVDSRVRVVYIDGYPRWEYRYLKNEMIREKSVEIACILTSADPGFLQEGDPPNPQTGFIGPLKFFPEKLETLMEFDVVLFGDVDPLQFTDAQLLMIRDFVGKKGGGFGMVAGPRFSPQAWRNTPIEPLLPVDISQVGIDDPNRNITLGFRPTVTREGWASSIFRFFPSMDANARFMAEEIQPLFWFVRGIRPMPWGEVLLEHPSEVAFGRKAPLLVTGRFGAGRTLFSAIDDSWRWRFYTGQHVHDTYWVQQFRLLARNRKLGQRMLTFAPLKTNYELGQAVTLRLRVLEATVVPQLSDQLRIELVDDKGLGVGFVALQRHEREPETYTGVFTADRMGRITAKLPSIASGIDPAEAIVQIDVPKLELERPLVDRASMARIAAETDGTLAELDGAAAMLTSIPSAARQVPEFAERSLWTWQALALFALLITTEWLLRKAYGML